MVEENNNIIEDIVEELEEIEELKDKLKFLTEKLKETKDKELRKEILSLINDLLFFKSDEKFIPISEESLIPSEIIKPIFFKEEPLEEILAPVSSKTDDSVKYDPEKLYNPSKLYEAEKKYNLMEQYESHEDEKDVTRAELELSKENSPAQSRSEDISEKLKKRKPYY